MSQKVKIVLNRSGVGQLLKGAEITSYLEDMANSKLSALGDGYDKSTYHGVNRVNVALEATTYKAAKDNYENNTLLKVMGI